MNRRISMLNKALVRIFMVVGLFALCGCGQSSSTPSTPGAADTSSWNSAPSDGQKPSEPLFAPKPIVVEAGTPIRVTVDQSVSSKTSNPGDHFEASLAVPVIVDGKVVIPSGARARGTVIVAKSAGKFKGNPELSVTLDSITLNGQSYALKTTSVTEAGKGRGKRTAIGAGAGHGKGAAIGAVAGAGAGTAGAAYTGERDITIAPESKLNFKLKEPLEIRGK